MKKTFYCVMSEFYDNGTIKAAIISQECEEKPKSSFRRSQGLDAYRDWFDSQKEAEAFLAETKDE
jgi:hypothetical protein